MKAAHSRDNKRNTSYEDGHQRQGLMRIVPSHGRSESRPKCRPARCQKSIQAGKKNKRGTRPLDRPQSKNTAREEPRADIMIVKRRSWWSEDQPRKISPGADAPVGILSDVFLLFQKIHDMLYRLAKTKRWLLKYHSCSNL